MLEGTALTPPEPVWPVKPDPAQPDPKARRPEAEQNYFATDRFAWSTGGTNMLDPRMHFLGMDLWMSNGLWVLSSNGCRVVDVRLEPQTAGNRVDIALVSRIGDVGINADTCMTEDVEQLFRPGRMRIG